MLLPPPGRFSTMNDWPSRSPSRWAMMRATKSVVPPAEVATRMRTGRAGQVSPYAMRGSDGSAAATAAKRRNERRAMNMRRPFCSPPPRAKRVAGGGRGRPPEQTVPRQELDHPPGEKPRVLELVGVCGPRQDRHLAARDARLQRECALVRRVLAAAENDRGTGDARLVILGVRLGMRLELADDRLEVGGWIALGEHVGEIARERCRAEGRT